MFLCIFFFFKQKTAYEMRISDWSSDVCSSDLLPPGRSKNNEENVVALGPWGQRLAQTNYEWLFPSPCIDGPQRAGWFKARDRIHARMEAFAGRIISRWHFSDLRRTFRSHARRVGIDNEIAELMITPKRRGIEGI